MLIQAAQGTVALRHSLMASTNPNAKPPKQKKKIMAEVFNSISIIG